MPKLFLSLFVAMVLVACGSAGEIGAPASEEEELEAARADAEAVLAALCDVGLVQCEVKEIFGGLIREYRAVRA